MQRAASRSAAARLTAVQLSNPCRHCCAPSLLQKADLPQKQGLDKAGGGAVSVELTDDVRIVGCAFDHNGAMGIGSMGGGLRAVNGGPLRISDSSFEANGATHAGSSRCCRSTAASPACLRAAHNPCRVARCTAATWRP